MSPQTPLNALRTMVKRQIFLYPGINSRYQRGNYMHARHLWNNINMSNKENGQRYKLFTPGPLSTTHTVKEVMQKDFGSRDKNFMEIVREIRERLLHIAAADNKMASKFAAILLQGCGTYAIEAVLQSSVGVGKILILENGAYGKRMERICQMAELQYEVLRFPENEQVHVGKVISTIEHKSDITHVAVVHCETSSGLINPIHEIGQAVKQKIPDSIYIVDAMSSFGAVPIDVEQSRIDFLVSSANKCLQGVPGLSFIIACDEALSRTSGISKSLAFDIYDQEMTLRKTGQFRFTPPTHVTLAFLQALNEHEEEGGVNGRMERYKINEEILLKGMLRLGFLPLLAPGFGSHIITSFRYPDDVNFNFQKFYEFLGKSGNVIYPGKISNLDCFRIGTIGDLHPTDFEDILLEIEKACRHLGLTLPLKRHKYL